MLIAIRCKILNRNKCQSCLLAVIYSINLAGLILYGLGALIASIDLSYHEPAEYFSMLSNNYPKNIINNTTNYSYLERNYSYIEKHNENNLLATKRIIPKNHLNEIKNNSIPIIHKLYDTGDDYYPKTLTPLIVILACFEISLFSWIVFVESIDERKKKLDTFLELNGISKIQSMFSLGIFFFLISLMPFLFFSVISAVVCKNGLTILIIIFYLLDLYLFIHLLYLLFSKYRFCFYFLLLLNTGLLGLGYALAYLKKRTIKFFFAAIFPNVNIYFSIGSMRRYKDYIYVRGISIEESIMFSCIQFILFLSLIIIVNKYKFLNCKNDSRNGNNQNMDLNQENEDTKLLNNNNIKSTNEEQNRNNNYLKILGISKEYKSCKAINNLNLELFPDDIFCLLGLDGSGKSTLVKTIIGLISPSEGDILFDGTSLVKNEELIYENISFCPQENILFDLLTIKEHFEYLSKISENMINPEDIPNIIDYLGLTEKQLTNCNMLTPQEKRKVCFALAMISRKKVIILDEPTKELDFRDKKLIWDFIKCNQKDRIIIISTDSPQEAEYLGTKIGIIKNGNLVCSGSINYLKQHYSAKNINIKKNIDLYINPETFKNIKEIFYEKVKECDPESEIKPVSNQIISLYLNDDSKIINLLEEAKYKKYILEYIKVNSDNNYSLGQIFNQICDISNLNENNNEIGNNNMFTNDINIMI